MPYSCVKSTRLSTAIGIEQELTDTFPDLTLSDSVHIPVQYPYVHDPNRIEREKESLILLHLTNSLLWNIRMVHRQQEVNDWQNHEGDPNNHE